MRKLLQMAALFCAPMMLVACGENPAETATVEEVPVEQVVEEPAATGAMEGDAAGAAEPAAQMADDQVGDSGPPER